MKDKKFINIFLSVIILLAIFHIGTSLENQYLNLRVRVFRILPFQSIITKTSQTPEGGVVGEMIGGDVTASFPDGTVLLETDLYQNNEDLVTFIKEKVKFSCLGKKVEISTVGASNFMIPKDLEAYLEKHEIEILTSVRRYGLYVLSISPMLVERGEAILNVSFHNFEKLIYQTVSVKFRRTLLVGFPSKEKGSKGAVYWLAFSFEDYNEKEIEN